MLLCVYRFFASERIVSDSPANNYPSPCPSPSPSEGWIPKSYSMSSVRGSVGRSMKNRWKRIMKGGRGGGGGGGGRKISTQSHRMVPSDSVPSKSVHTYTLHIHTTTNVYMYCMYYIIVHSVLYMIDLLMLLVFI